MDHQKQAFILPSQFGRVFFVAFLTLFVIFFFFTSKAFSSQVTLAWDANTEAGLAGYKVYYGFEPGNYIDGIDVGNKTSYLVTGLDENRTIYFAATAYDANGNESEHSKEVIFKTENQPPLADAGPDQTIREGTIANLSGSNSSDPEGGSLFYSWEQTYGSTVILSDPKAAQLNFTTPDVGQNGESLIFRLTVTDNNGLQSEDYCTINVSWVNLPPTANAGPDITADEGYEVNLDGLRSSDPDDGIVAYLWEQTGGPEVAILNPRDLQTSFIAPSLASEGVVSLSFRLTVQDSGGLIADDACVVNVTWEDTPPTADAGQDRTVSAGDAVTLDGSASMDPDDGIASIRWSQTKGIPVTLSDPTARQPKFIAPAVGSEGEILVFQITVADKGGLASQDTCTVVTVAGPTVYENAEDGKTYGWAIYDNIPNKASILNVFDYQRWSRVIELKGTKTENGFVLRNEDTTSWHNSKQLSIQWCMKYKEYFVVYVDVQTTGGHRYIYYTPDDQDGLGTGEYVHHGLGPSAMNGQWHTFTRDLQRDLDDAQSGVDILEVNGFLIRGSGRVDEIQLKSM